MLSAEELAQGVSIVIGEDIVLDGVEELRVTRQGNVVVVQVDSKFDKG